MELTICLLKRLKKADVKAIIRMEIDANATHHVVLTDIGIDTMMPENSVDAFAFWCVLSIFAVVVGNLIYESLRSSFYVEPKCPAPCCGEEE